jgi:hypothetical protein
MSTGADDLKPIETAVNDTAGQVRVLWISFISFQIYLAIAAGSVTHRMLFLETGMKLPGLNVELSLLGFFTVAPFILLTLHLYVLLQLLTLARKLSVYNDTLMRVLPLAADRRRRRLQLDAFVFVQLLAGTRDGRLEISSILYRVIALITMVIAPVLLLLQLQVTFLPYHDQVLTWLHRLGALVDLVLVWTFWAAIQPAAREIARPSRWRHGLALTRSAIAVLFAIVLSMVVLLFSMALATFPGEWWRHVLEDRAQPVIQVSDRLFGGEEIAANEVTGVPRTLFSNVLILTDQVFVDREKLEKLDRTISLRGRDLRRAVLTRTDLRKADFTGAMLNGADLGSANLAGAKLDCALIGESRSSAGAHAGAGRSQYGCTSLQRAVLDYAYLQGASLRGAKLQGANLTRAYLEGAYLADAELQGASLIEAQLQGASLSWAQLQARCSARRSSRARRSLERNSRARRSPRRRSRVPISAPQSSRAQVSRTRNFRARISRARSSRAQISRARIFRARL